MKTSCLLFAFVVSLLSVRGADPAIRIVRDITYLAPDRAEKLDLYLPAPLAPDKRTPAIVWIHGGGWTGGEKGEARGTEVCTTLANAGYIAVSINYRLGDSAWPQDLLDCKNAVRFLRAHAAEYRLDPERIAVAGGSAGGHLSLMVGFTTGKKEFEPDAPYPGVSSAVRCIINMYGITDLVTRDQVDAKGEPTATRKLMARSLKAFNAATDADAILRLASPIHHVARNSPPVLTLHGRADATVDFPQAEKLVAVLQPLGVAHEEVFLDEVGHSFDWEKSGDKPLPRDLRPTALAFLAKHLGPPVK